MRDAELEDLFAAAGAARPEPSAILLARIEQDATEVQGRFARPEGRPAASGPRLARLRRAWFGGSLFAGLGTAALAGVVIGLVQPAPIASLTEALWADGSIESVDLFPPTLEFLTEG